MKITVGTDIVKHERVNLKIAKRIFTDAEYQVYEGINDHLKLEHLASRFAAKEAIVKATDKAYAVTQVEILNTESGKPYCSNINGIELSISHEEDYSVAFAIYIR